MKKVIITGAGGFIGSELTRKYVNSGYEVIAVSLDFGNSFPENPQIRRICTEIVEPEKLLELIPKDEYEAFYHLAWRGVNGAEKANPLIQINNVIITLGCAQVARELGCKKFLCAGTIAEMAINSLPDIEKPNGGLLYGAAKYSTHIMLETYCKSVGLKYIWMQFSNIYGPQNKTGNLVSYTVSEVIAGREATFGPANQPYDFIFVDDLIEAVYRLGVLQTNKSFYFIGSGKPRILKDYLIEMGNMLGKPELIKIGVRPDDGVKYSEEMFVINDLVEDIGKYIETNFEEGFKCTIEKFK